jgi:hypothetical protein
MPRYHRFCLPNRKNRGFVMGKKNTLGVVDVGHTTGDRPTAEVSTTFHQTYAKIININPNTIQSSIDRVAFAYWRSQYWINRALGFINNER